MNYLQTIERIYQWMRFSRDAHKNDRIGDILLEITADNIKTNETRYVGFGMYLSRKAGYIEDIGKLFHLLVKEDEAEGNYCLSVYFMKMRSHYFDHISYQNNKLIGMIYLKRAAELMHSDALFDLALTYEITDIDKFMSLSTQSAKLGNKYAIDKLNRYYLEKDDKYKQLIQLLQNNLDKGDDYSVNIMIQLNINYDTTVSIIKECLEKDKNRIIKLDMDIPNLHFEVIQNITALYIKKEVNNERFIIDDTPLKNFATNSKEDELSEKNETIDLANRKKRKNNNIVIDTKKMKK